MDLPKRKQIRLTEYDYRMPNAYFITVCTRKKRNLFWENVGAGIARPEDVRLSPAGMAAQAAILEIPRRYSSLTVDCYVVMPNHVHLLLQINSDASGRPMVAPTISRVVQQMKGAASKQAGFSLWQKGFYDHVIRNEKDYEEVWKYIEGNPGKWTE